VEFAVSGPTVDKASDGSASPENADRDAAGKSPVPPSALSGRDPGPSLAVRLAARESIVRLLIALAILALGVTALWLASAIKTDNAYDLMSARFAIWREVSQILFLLSLAVLISDVALRSPWMGVILFFISLEPLQQLLTDFVTQSWAQVQPVLKMVFPDVSDLSFMMVAVGLYAIAFAAGTVILRPGGDLDLFQRPDELIGSPASKAARRSLNSRRRRIKGYFSKRPWWPLPAAIAAIILILFSLAADDNAEDKLFQWWMTAVTLVFSYSALALLWERRKRKPVFYLNVFGAVVLMGSLLADKVIGYPYTERQKLLDELSDLNARYGATTDNVLRSQLSDQYNKALDTLSSLYHWYWIALGALVLVYAILFRYVIYRRWHLASDAEVDATIADDLNQVTSRAFRRLGVDRAKLIAEPLYLRGFPDRSTASRVFCGSWIGGDDRLRFTPISATVIAFTEEQTLFYDIAIDLTTGIVVDETNTEFFYQDVSSVARASTTQVLDLHTLFSWLGRLRGFFQRSEAARTREIKDRSVNDSVQLPGRDLFVITLSSGRQLTIVMRDNTFFDIKRKRIVWVQGAAAPRPKATDGDGDLPLDENERAVRNVRRMLRDKKRALLLDQA
jgi:hypothetical protein